MRIDELGLDDNTVAALAQAGIETVDQLPQDLQTIEGIGKGRAEAIRAAIAGARTESTPDAGAGQEPDGDSPATPDDGATQEPPDGDSPATPDDGATQELDGDEHDSALPKGWSGKLRDGKGIARREVAGVRLKLIADVREGVPVVDAVARDRHDRAGERFTGPSAIVDAARWADSAASAIAATRPREAQRLVPVGDVKGASTEVLAHRLDLIGDPAGDIAAGKETFKAEQDATTARMRELERDLLDNRQAWREESRRLQALVMEQGVIEAELTSRKRKAEVAARRAKQAV